MLIVTANYEEYKALEKCFTQLNKVVFEPTVYQYEAGQRVGYYKYLDIELDTGVTMRVYGPSRKVTQEIAVGRYVKVVSKGNIREGQYGKVISIVAPIRTAKVEFAQPSTIPGSTYSHSSILPLASLEVVE